MELELGLKITKTKDDIDSISEYQLMKDTGPVFQSRETNTIFILTAHLKGYKRNCIDIKISKDGSKISISGEKPIQEMVMMGWVMQRKVVDVKGFNKVFKIPYGVNLDKIKGNYNEEEWILNIYMPKLVKGICGLKIEEVKEQEFDKRRLELERGEIDHVSSSVGETSQKESKDSEFQHMEGSDNGIEKMLDDNIKEINNETIQKGEEDNGIKRDITKCLIEKEKIESKLRIEDSKVKDIRERNGKEAYEALKTLEIEKDVGKGVGEASKKGSKDYEIEHIEKMLDDKNKEINKERIQKEVGEYKLGIEDGSGEEVRVDDGKEQYDVLKKSELDQSVGVFVPNTIEDTGQDKQFEDKRFECRIVEKEREECDKRHDDSKRHRVGSIMKKEESKLRIEDRMANSTREIEKDVGKDISHNIVDTSQIVVEGSMIQKSGEPKEKEFGEKKGYSKSRLKENVVDHIPNNIDFISQSEFAEPKVPQMGKTKTNDGKTNGGESKKLPFEANEDVQKSMFGDIIQKGIIRAKLESEDEDQECVGEKFGKEGFDDAKITINEEFDKYLPKESPNTRDGLNVQEMQEAEVVKENVVKRKGKEIEDFVEEGEDERLKRMHVEAKKGNTKETTQEEIEEINESGIKESGKQPVAEIEGSKGFNVAAEDQRDTATDIVNLKGHESRKLNVEPNEPFEGDTTPVRIKKEITNQKFQEMEQTEDYKEKSMKKLNGENYQKIQNEEIGKSKQKEFGELEFETKDRLEESSIKPFDPTKASKLEQNVVDHIPSNIGCINQSEFKEECENPPFEAKQVVQKSMFGKIIKPNMETEDVDQECVGEKPNKEGFDAITINEEFPKNLPKNTHEESEGLNVKKMQETKDVIENMVKRKRKKIEYLVEKSEGERLKRVHREGKKGNNTRETMQKSEESENGNKETAQQHAKENFVNEMSEVLKNMTEELQHPVENINGSNEFTVAEEEEEKEVIKEAFVKSESLMEKVEEEESKERTMAKRVEDEENKIEPNEPFEGDTSKDRIEKEIINQKFQENVDIEKFDERKTNKFQEMEETELSKEKDTTIERSMKKVNGDKFKKIPNEVDEGFKKNIIKEKDDCYLQEEMSKDRSKEDFPMKMLDSPGDAIEGVKGRKIEKAKGINEESEKVVPFVKGESEEPKIPMKIKDQQYLQEEEPNDHEMEKAKRVKGQVAKRKIDEFLFAESTTKEEPQGSEIERNSLHIFEIPKAKDLKGIETRTPERELQSARGPTTYATVESIGFKEFDYGSAKEKKQNTKVLPPKFQNKETHESKDESMSPKKSQEVGEHCTHNITSTKEVESIEDKVVKPLSTLRFQSTQQSEVEEKDKFCEGNKANYQGSIDLVKEHPTKDIQNLIEMEETLNSEIPLEKELMKGEKGEFHDGEKVVETMQLKTNEPKNKIDAGDKYVAKDVGKFETRGKDMSKEYKIAQNVNHEKSKKHDEITKAGIEKMDKGKCFDEKMKTTQAKEVESLESSQKKWPLELEMPDLQCEFPKTKEYVRAPELRDGEQHGYIKEGTEEIKAPKIEASEGTKPSTLQSPRFNQQSTDEINRKPEFSIEEHKETKESPKLNIVETEKIDGLQPQILDRQEEVLDLPNFQTQKTLEEEKVVKIRQGPKISKIKETKYVSSLKREKGKTTQTTEEKKPKIMEITPQFGMASGSKRVTEKLHEAPKRECQRESEQVASTMEVEPRTTVEKTPIKKVQQKKPHELLSVPNMGNGISKVEEEQEEKEGAKNNQELEASVYNEKEDRGQQYGQEKNDQKGFQRLKTAEEDKVMKKKEGPKVAKSEEEMKFKLKEITPQFDKASGSKRVVEKIHETLNREHQREIEKVTPKVGVEPPTSVEKTPTKNVERKEPHEFTKPPNMDKEIPKGTDAQKNARVPKNSSPRESFHSLESTLALEAVADKVVQKSKVPSSSCTQQFEVEGEEKTKRMESKMDAQDSRKNKTGQEVEQCINKDEEAKHVIEDKVVKPISAQRFQISQQSEVEENDKLFEGSEAKYRSSLESRGEDLTNDIQNLIEVKGNQEAKQKETLKPEIPLEKDIFKELKTTQNVIGEITKATIGKVDKAKCIHETSKATQDKKHTLKLQVNEKEAESLETGLKNDFPKTKDHVQVPELKDDKQHGSETEEIKSPKIAAYQGAKPSKLQRPMINQQSTDEINRKPEFVIEEHEGTKAFSPMLNIVESENIVSLQPQLLESPGREDEEVKPGIEDIEEDKTYKQVLEDEKEVKDETSEGKKDNAKISKKLFVPMVLAGSAILVTLVVIFVQHRRSRKR